MKSYAETLCKEEKQILWVLGSYERLEGLGLMAGGFCGLSPDAIDTYHEIDEDRENLFSSFDEFVQIATETIMADINMMIQENISKGEDSRSSWELMGCKNQEEQVQNITNIIYLLNLYRKDRESITKYALNRLMNKES